MSDIKFKRDTTMAPAKPVKDNAAIVQEAMMDLFLDNNFTPLTTRTVSHGQTYTNTLSCSAKGLRNLTRWTPSASY